MHRFTLITFVTLTVCVISTSPRPQDSSPNHDLLTKLGMQKIKAPNSHHRKRLAVESRHHGRSDDSHMFIIKLPPNPHYYVHNRPNAILDETKMKSKKVPVGFKSNGRPAKVYHWNIPVLKKIAKSKSHNFDPNGWNEVLEKRQQEKKERKDDYKPSYYVPAKPKKSSFTKYFPGNGKPHSFYVIENSRKAHYHRLLP